MFHKKHEMVTPPFLFSSEKSQSRFSLLKGTASMDEAQGFIVLRQTKNRSATHKWKQ
jgi:hypothetical protein